MKILILGGDGMLGHQLLKTLSGRHDVRVTLRQSMPHYEPYGLFNRENSFADVDVRLLPRLEETVARFQPQAIVNCVGLVKQRHDAKDVIPNLEVNALLPHRLAELCCTTQTRLIQISTDCVFSGRTGMYREDDIPDAEDTYGRTKLLGEVTGSNCLTLRTSIVGRELARKGGLLEWFLAQQQSVKGFKNAIFSGFSTAEFSSIIRMLLEQFPDASGLYHVSSEPIDKYTLLHLFREQFSKTIEIIPYDAFAIDRSLDSSKFRQTFSYIPPSWRKMASEL